MRGHVRKFREKAGLTGKIEVKNVYFILAPILNRVKIGFTSDVASRFSYISTSSPEKLTLLGFVPGTFHDERKLHELFSKYRSHLEWFDYTEEVQQGISEILKTGVSFLQGLKIEDFYMTDGPHIVVGLEGMQYVHTLEEEEWTESLLHKEKGRTEVTTLEEQS